MRKRTVITEDVEGVDCELSFEPVEHCDSHKARVGDMLIYGYLVYDDDCNSLDDLMGDCMGELYSFHRHAGRDDHSNGLEALGNNSDGEADLEAVYSNHMRVADQRYLDKIYETMPLADVLEDMRGEYDQAEGETDIDFVTESLRQDLDHNNWDCVHYYELMEKVLEEMWAEPEFFPGDPDAQLLSCYSHSGEHWSLSGRGMQCRWDTSNSAGVWVPDEYLRKELDSAQRQAVYALVENTSWIRGTGKRHQLLRVDWKDDKTCEKVFVRFSDDAGDLHKEAREIAANKPEPTAAQLRWGREQQATIYCEQFLDMYNEINSGQVFGVVVEWFDDSGTATDNDACWGFVGSDHAEESLKETFDSVVASLQKDYDEDVRTQCGAQLELA